ncbi:TatD family hydrolase [Candidatus Bathyarchaeota archaeon]|nr:TatD family hydrolase [Candidatus Bathyarchaeota archaeon]
MYSESHCHLGDMSLGDIREAEKMGFKLLLTSGIDSSSSEQAITTARRHEIVKSCVGVHPWYADEYNDDVGERFRELVKDPECVAISEIGLDFIGRMTHEWVREDRFIDPKIQYASLDAQLGIARELKMPAIVHDRAPGHEMLEILIKSGNTDTGLAIHGFSKDIDYARKCVDHGILLSVGLRTLQVADPIFIKAVAETPIEYLLTETDSSKPEGVITCCELIGEVKGMPKEDVGAACTRNLKRLLGL